MGKRQALPDGAVEAGRVLRGLGERGSRRLSVSKLLASVGFLPVALLIVMQQFDCSC